MSVVQRLVLRLLARWVATPGRPLPADLEALAQYNAERERGIVHTSEWVARMAAVQAEFIAWRHAEEEANPDVPLFKS